VLAGNRAARVPQHAQPVQLAGRLHDAGQHQLAEHLVASQGLLEPEHPAGMDKGIHQMPHPRRRDGQRATPPARGMAAAKSRPRSNSAHALGPAHPGTAVCGRGPADG